MYNCKNNEIIQIFPYSNLNTLRAFSKETNLNKLMNSTKLKIKNEKYADIISISDIFKNQKSHKNDSKAFSILTKVVNKQINEKIQLIKKEDSPVKKKIKSKIFDRYFSQNSRNFLKKS